MVLTSTIPVKSNVIQGKEPFCKYMLWPHHSTFSKFQTLGGNFSFLHGSNLLLIGLLTCQQCQILLYYYDFYLTNVLSALNKEINTYHKLKFINSTHRFLYNKLVWNRQIFFSCVWFGGKKYIIIWHAYVQHHAYFLYLWEIEVNVECFSIIFLHEKRYFLL